MILMPCERQRLIVLRRAFFLLWRRVDLDQRHLLRILMVDLLRSDIATPLGTRSIAIPSSKCLSALRDVVLIPICTLDHIKAGEGKEGKAIYVHLKSLIVDHCECTSGVVG